MKFLSLVWSSFKRKKVRTILTLASIVVAFTLFGYLAAIKQAFSQGVDVAGADRLIVRHKVSIIQFLPMSYEADMEQIEGVADATHATWFGGIYQEPKNFFAQLPVKPEEYLAMYPEFLLPAEQKEAWVRTRTGAIVGRTLAERFGFEIGDKVPIQATIWPKTGNQLTWEFDIVGIYDGAEQGTDTTQLLFQYDYFDEARQYLRGQVSWYVVRVEDPDDSARVARAIDDTFANSPAETKAETEGAFLTGFAEQIGNIGAMITAIVSAVFFTILLVAGEHDGAVGARAHRRARRPQGGGIHRHSGFGLGPRGVGDDRGARRTHRARYRGPSRFRRRSDRRLAPALLFPPSRRCPRRRARLGTRARHRIASRAPGPSATHRGCAQAALRLSS